MQKLKPKHKQKLQDYAESINTHIQELQSKKLYSFMLVKIPFVDDYRIGFVGHTSKLEEAQELGDILIAGMQNIVSIVVEDGLGIKEYSSENEEEDKLKEFREEVEEHYPYYIEFDVSTPINTTMKKLEEKEKTDTLYYRKLKTLNNKMTNIREVVYISFKVQRLIESLEWKFVKIIIAVGLTKIEKIPAYSDVTRLEEEARAVCEELVAQTKEYDKGIQELALLQI
jgi:hypothetical protein